MHCGGEATVGVGFLELCVVVCANVAWRGAANGASGFVLGADGVFQFQATARFAHGRGIAHGHGAITARAKIATTVVPVAVPLPNAAIFCEAKAARRVVWRQLVACGGVRFWLWLWWGDDTNNALAIDWRHIAVVFGSLASALIVADIADGADGFIFARDLIGVGIGVDGIFCKAHGAAQDAQQHRTHKEGSFHVGSSW